MKWILLVPIALAISAGTAAAAPVCLENQTYQSFIDLGAGGCTIGDKLFSNFGFSSSAQGRTPPAASQIQVATDPGDGVTNPGILFSSGSIAVFSGQTMDVTLTFTVSAPPAFKIKDASLTSAGNVLMGTGVGTVTETLQNGGNPIPGSPLVLSGFAAGSAGVDFVGAGGIPLSSLDVTTQIHLHGNVPGIVSISAVTEHFSEVNVDSVPEPAAAFLLGSGFLMLGLKWRRRGGERTR